MAVDTSDAPLREPVARLPASAPHLMKPNGDELASVTSGAGEAVESDPAAAASAARELVHRGVGTVLVTLGGAGAVLVDSTAAWYATAPPVEVVSTVGAGDSSLFGYLLGHIRGLPAPDCLALAVAYGRAAVSLPGTSIPAPQLAQNEYVTVDQLATA